MRVLTPLLVLAASASAAFAPMQCQSEPPPEQNRYEHPPEALYALSQRLRAAGEVKAWRITLETIVERYPNSREAVMAKDDLGANDAAGAGETTPDP